MHWPRIHGLYSVSWCLAEGQWNEDQHRPMGRKAREGLYSLFLLPVIESRDFKVCQKLTSSDLNETWYDVRGRRVIHDDMTFEVIWGQGQGEEMTSVPYQDYFYLCHCIFKDRQNLFIILFNTIMTCLPQTSFLANLTYLDHRFSNHHHHHHYILNVQTISFFLSFTA